MKKFTALLIVIFFVSANLLLAQNAIPNKFCINSYEKEMLKIINQYRKSKNLPAVQLSAELTKVAKIHAHDLDTNHPDTGVCNMHSWSDKGTWKNCCYTEDHKNSKLMWSKPGELTNYKSEGYEIAYKTSGNIVPSEVLTCWKKSTGHNNVITEKGTFNKIKWKAIGISAEGYYVLIWFGTEPDKEPALPECKK